MVSSATCPECGKAIAADAPLGVCPGCLLRLTVEGTPISPYPAASGGFESDPLAPVGLAGQFPDLEILEQIGQGGMGVVYRARQKKLERLVALKLIRPDSVGRTEFAHRFAREARAMAQLNHPNIATIHDFGEGGGFCSLVMELVEGDDLRKRLRGGAWEPGPALGVILQVCDALQYAHAAGVVHRDIKPENVLIDRAGRVKIVDFGLAKLVQPDGVVEPMSASRQVLGTPRYMAPEQIESPRSVDHRADIYAVGLLLYETMTGEVPFGRYDLLSERVGTCESLDEILARCLARDPGARYQSVGLLLNDLAEFAQEQYELATPARAVLEDDSQSSGRTAKVKTGDASGDMDGWGCWGFFAGLFLFPTFYHQLVEICPPGPVRLTVSLLICAPVVFLLAWFFARSRDWRWAFFIAGPIGVGWIATDVGEFGSGAWAPICGVLAQVGLLASGVAAFWGWRVEAQSSLANPAPARGPAIGLIVLGALNYLAFVLCVSCLAGLLLLKQVRIGNLTLTAAQAQPLLPLCVSTAIAGGVIVMAGIRLFQGASPALARAASVLAMAPLTPVFLLGLPIGFWTIAVLGGPQLAADPSAIGQNSARDGVKPSADGLNASALAGDNRA